MNRPSPEDRIRDIRPLVLLAAGLFIVAFPIMRSWITEIFRPGAEPVPLADSFAWRSGSSLPEGIYIFENSGPTSGNILSPFASPHPRLAPFFFLPLPINDCDEQLLISIPGLGPALAGRIMEFRRQHGRIGGAEDLLRIKGIGPAKLREIRDLIVFE